MILLPRSDQPERGLSRRRALVAGALAVVATRLAACSPAPQPPPPDPLEPLAARAHTDAALASAVAAAHANLAPAVGVAATIRTAHAAALDRELDRAHPSRASTPTSAPRTAPSSGASAGASVPPDHGADLTSLVSALLAAEKEAADAALTLPRYRAGLVASIAAGCACSREVLA